MDKTTGYLWIAAVLTASAVSCSQRNPEVRNDSVSDLNSVRADSVHVISMAYSRAIAEYINASFPGDSLPDTLFIGKHNQFPEIKLPYTIQNIPVLLLTNEEYEPKTKYRPHSVFLNMIGTSRTDSWEFKIVAFHDWGKPQHNCIVNLDYNAVMKDFSLDTLYYEYVYPRAEK